MRYEQPYCPNCHALATGTMEALEGYARLQWADDVHRPDPALEGEWEGETVIFWDAQRTQRRDGRVLLFCENCTETWLSRDLDTLPGTAATSGHLARFTVCACYHIPHTDKEISVRTHEAVTPWEALLKDFAEQKTEGRLWIAAQGLEREDTWAAIVIGPDGHIYQKADLDLPWRRIARLDNEIDELDEAIGALAALKRLPAGMGTELLVPAASDAALYAKLSELTEQIAREREAWHLFKTTKLVGSDERTRRIDVDAPGEEIPF